MKTIVLMGISCLMLAGVYGVMDKQSAVSKVLSFNQANSSVSSIGVEHLEKAAPGTDSIKNRVTTSNTLDDSHWIDDPLFEKAAGSELITDNESDMTTTQQEAAPETTRQVPQKGEETIKDPKPEVKQLILELNPDTAAPGKKIPTEVI
jgi:hypothetical protein